MKKSNIKTAFWNDVFIEQLPTESKLLYIYLLTNVNTLSIGCYEITKERIAFETGIKQENVEKMLIFFEDKKKIQYDENTSEILIVNTLKHLSLTKAVQKRAIKEIEGIKSEYLKSLVKDNFSKLINNQEKRQIKKAKKQTIKINTEAIAATAATVESEVSATETKKDSGLAACKPEKELTKQEFILKRVNEHREKLKEKYSENTLTKAYVNFLQQINKAGYDHIYAPEKYFEEFCKREKGQIDFEGMTRQEFNKILREKCGQKLHIGNATEYLKMQNVDTENISKALFNKYLLASEMPQNQVK